MIELERVSHCYGDLVAVDDVSLEFARGTITVFVGTSGSGKIGLALVAVCVFDMAIAAAKGRISKEQTLKERALKRLTSEGQALKGRTPKGLTLKGQTLKERAPEGQTLNRQTLKERAPEGQTLNRQTPKGQTPEGQA